MKLKSGMLGMPCYDKYVYEAWQLISKYGQNGKGGIAYYGQVRLFCWVGVLGFFEGLEIGSCGVC